MWNEEKSSVSLNLLMGETGSRRELTLPEMMFAPKGFFMDKAYESKEVTKLV